MRKNILFIIYTSAALVVLALSFFLGLDIFIVKKEVIVPSVIGLTEKEARAILRKERVHFRVIDQETKEYDNDIVYYQYPKRGRVILKNYPVEIYVAKNDYRISVPDLSGLDIENAGSVLRDSRLLLGRVKTAKGKINLKNQIVYQDPPAGTKAEQGSRIDVTVNDGMVKDYVIVPYLMKNDYEFVRKVIKDMGLKEINPKTKGDIVYQSIFPGTMVRIGSAIEFEVTDITGADTSSYTPTKIKDTSADEYRYETYEYEFGNFPGRKRLKAVLIEDGVKLTFLNERIMGGYKISKIIKFIKTASVEVYLNGELVDSKEYSR